MVKIYSVYRSSNANLIAMLRGAYGGAYVYPIHHLPSQKFTYMICIMREDKFRFCYNRFADFFSACHYLTADNLSSSVVLILTSSFARESSGYFSKNFAMLESASSFRFNWTNNFILSYNDNEA